MNSFLVILLFLAVRLASVFIVQTFYVPDEYWQSLEVAHKLTFGYGYLTWEWIHGLRSYLYPSVFAGLYKLLSTFELDTVELLVIAPRILQAILSAYADYRFYIWAGKKKWAIFLIIVPYFWFYTASRTLSNTLETSLTTIALSYFPWEEENTSFLWLVALCCYIRPTSAIVWLPLCLYHLKRTKLSIWELILKRYLLIGLLVLTVGCGFDSYFYGKFLITPWEFLKYNFFQGIGSFYGTHPWYWYFQVGLPTILGINTLPFMYGVIETIRHSEIYPTRQILLITILVTLSAFSCVEHKEFRFVLCLLPMCLYICSDCLSRWSYKATRLVLWVVAATLIVGNLFPLWYLSVVHQRGTLDIMPHLANIAKEYRSENNNRANILFLMPCHSTPFYSHIHENVTMRFLTCEPNLKQTENYLDEADNFYKAPEYWLRSHLPIYPKTALPTHIVLFEPLSEKISNFLMEYDVIYKVPHAEFATERTGKDILIYERRRPREEKNIFSTVDEDEDEDEIES